MSATIWYQSLVNGFSNKKYKGRDESQETEENTSHTMLSFIENEDSFQGRLMINQTLL